MIDRDAEIERAARALWDQVYAYEGNDLESVFGQIDQLEAAVSQMEAIG